MIKAEDRLMLGGKLTLNSKELKVDSLLRKIKDKEVKTHLNLYILKCILKTLYIIYQQFSEGFDSPGIYPPANHFFNSKSLIDESKVFNFIKKMPKGKFCSIKGNKIKFLMKIQLIRSKFTYSQYSKCFIKMGCSKYNIQGRNFAMYCFL